MCIVALLIPHLSVTCHIRSKSQGKITLELTEGFVIVAGL